MLARDAAVRGRCRDGGREGEGWERDWEGKARPGVNAVETTSAGDDASRSGRNIEKGMKRGELEAGYTFGCLDLDEKLWKLMKVEEKPKKLERRRLQENPILVKSDENNLNHSLQESNGKKN